MSERARSWRMQRRCLCLLGLGLVLGVLALDASEVWARPGGGHSYSGGGGFSSSSYSGGSRSYSGGGSSYSGGGGSYSGGGDMGGFEIFLALIMIGGWAVSITFQMMSDGQGSHYDSSYDHAFTPPPPPPLRATRIDWAKLRERDPEFSLVVFEDFLYQLYARVQEARGDEQAMASLAPYVVEGAREAIAKREPRGVKITQVVVGSMGVAKVDVQPDRTDVEVYFETNISAEAEGGAVKTYYLRERWFLTRAPGVQSKAPEAATALKCPNCGAPFVATADQRCDYCGEVVDNGRFDWLVARTRLLEQRSVPPTLGGYAPEVGTDRPTLVAPSFMRDFARLLEDDHGLEPAAIEARVRKIYDRLNTAWMARNLGHARAYLSDGIWDYLSYWLDAYRRQGMINCLEDMAIESMEFVKLTRDRHYDALTVRIFASGLDYTVREKDDSHVGGSRTRPRRYSEYWTLIRGAGVEGEAHSDGGCPNCGAPLAVNMAGNCEHCSAHLTRGEFDWVLSRIEQDESYAG